ncbi:A-kinase anchor protein 11 isoform X1 [Python bivittatus]|uniref:A-kinase anchor protein 11 isoform X1 n=1 Tax=Python bivittatus TaxID=176946 RepID=A0A9F2NBG8_PYTBI|nr:A-kinase anchor protein 11 isoform X1 [Python bivittatus]
MDGHIRVQSCHKNPRGAMKKNFSESSLSPMMALLQSQKQLCTISTEELTEEQENFNEVTFLCFANDTAIASKELATNSVELPDVLKSFHLCSLHEQEVLFLKDICKPAETSDDFRQRNCPSRILCVMRLSSSFPRLRVDTVFTLLSKYSAAIRCTEEMYSLQKHVLDSTHTENDDTNQSVSSIEDDFVTALEHLDEDEPAKMTHSEHITSEKSQDAAPKPIYAHHFKSNDQKSFINSLYRKPSVKSSISLVNILELEELSSSVRNSVSTSISDPWIQRSFFRSHNSSDRSVNFLHKTLFSSSPAESSESDCSSPSPVIFLDEEGYQKSLKAKLQLPKIPVGKDGIEDSDSEVSEFFDSFDQFDEHEQTSENGSKVSRDPIVRHTSQKNVVSFKKSCSTTTSMNPQKFKFDCPVLPANVRKPTPRKPESPYNNLLDVPDSPRLIKNSADDSGVLFSPIRSSAFSPLGSCFSTECLCRINRDAFNQNHNLVYHTYSDFANNISFEILGSVCNSRPTSLCRCTQEMINHSRIVPKEEKDQTAKIKREMSRKGLNKKDKSKHKSVMIKDHIQKFASELVEKSFGSAFKDLQKGVSSCTNALCHLAAKLTSSVFQMAFYEIGRQQAFSLKKKAINGLAGFLVSEAVTGALKELYSVKQQIFTNTVTKFAANLAEELIFEGIMEVCQFSHPSTPTASHHCSFQYNDNIVSSYAKDLSESVIQDAFIELSQVDVTFTSQAAISISMDNVKYVSPERMVALTQTSSTSSELCDKVPVALNPIWEFRKEHTINRALFYTSGIASSIPVPLAGSLLSQHQILWNEAKVKSHLATDSRLTFYKESTEVCYAAKKNQSEISVRNIYLTTDFTPDNECNPPNHPDANKISEISSISNFSGKMVDMIVSEAYEAVTSSKVSKTAEQYTDMLKTKKTPYLQCIGEDSCKNMFANYLAKRIIKQSVDQTKSACSATSEKLAYCVGLGTNIRSNKKELHSAVKQGEKKKNIPVIVGQQQMPLNNTSKFHVTPVYSNRCLLLGSKDCVQEKKSQVACRPSTCTFPPCSVVSFVKPAEQFPDAEDCSAIPIGNLLEKQSTYKAAGCSLFGHEMPFLDINNSSVVPKCEDALQLEDKLNVRDRNLVIPETPPSTPLIPSQASSEWNLRKLTKKLKGELAKEFAPATPPSTPYVSETDGIYTHGCENLEKEEFMLKLMRSLSEEVENNEVEEHSETLTEQIKPSGATIDYADHLATHIISMATEMAASHLEDKAIQTENNKYFQVSMENKRRGYTTFVNVPEKNIHSLWLYAGEMAGKVIREAKKRVKSRHCKLLRLSQVNYEGDCFHLKRNYHEYWSKDKILPLADQCSREQDCSTLPVPLNSEASGLNSKYPSCESVTDEYADHIIRILKQEGGHSELIMDNFASSLAYKSIKSGIQQAVRKLQVKYSRKRAPETSSKLNNKFELFDSANQDMDLKKQKNSIIHHLVKQPCRNKCHLHGTENTKLLDFSESLACSITSDARRKFTSATSLPKSLTDSCLYKRSRVDKVTDFKTTLTKRLSSSCCKQKLYHSTDSLTDCTYQDNILQAIDQYAKKIVDDTLEVSLESATLQAPEGWTNGERLTYTEKLAPFSIAACKYCSMKEHHHCVGSSSLQLAGQELPSKIRQASDGSVNITFPKSHVLHLDIPKIHVDMDEKVIFAENVAPTTFDRARRQLSNTSLTADSGIGQDGISFAESLTTEIMTSCMTNIAPAINISAMEIEGLNSAESAVSQQMSLSTGDDSTGSWSNLSFDDEHPDENSSFLHLSDSNGNSSSWSSLGLEGDLYEENLSFPTSDSDGVEDKEEELKDSIEELRSPPKALVIVNVDIGPCMVDSQLRMTLQWLSASEADVAELRFHDDTPVEFVLLSKTLQEKGWKVGDLFQAVLKYCEAMEKSADGERTLESKTLFGWLQEHV